MSQENVEIAVGYFEATDLGGAVESLADDATFVFHGESRHLAGAETFSGKKQAIEWLADWFSRFDPGYRMEVNESRDWGDRVLVVTTHAKGRKRRADLPADGASHDPRAWKDRATGLLREPCRSPRSRRTGE